MQGFENISKLAMNSKAGTTVQDLGPGEWTLEPKYDGIRLLIHRNETGIMLYARSGNSKTGALPELEAELAAALPPGTWLDAEAVAFNEDGTQDWGGAASVLGSSANRFMDRSKVSLVIFDFLAHGGIDARGLPLSQRRACLEEVHAGAGFSARIILSPQLPATDESHDANLEAGFEGSMVKKLSAKYESGKRSHSSIKLKATDTVDAVITGFGPGRPDSWIAKAGLIGVIEFTHFHDGQAIEGKCSGMTVKVREELTANQAEMVGQVVEVSYMTRMPSGSLRHPNFKRIRTDKTAEECAT